MKAALERPHWMTLAAGLALTAGCGVRPPAEVFPTAPQSGPATGAIAVTSEQLARDFAADLAAADGKYREKCLAVEGPLEDLALFPSGRVLVRLAGSAGDPGKGLGHSVRCEFVPEATAKVTDLTKGQKLKCKGKCAGATAGGFVDLTECELLDIGPDPTVAVSAARLAGDYAAGEKSADGKYRGKSLLVEGTVRELRDKEDGLTVVLEGADEKALYPVRVCITCPPERKEEFAHLKKGSHMKVKGECGGNFLGEVQLGSARLVR